MQTTNTKLTDIQHLHLASVHMITNRILLSMGRMPVSQLLRDMEAIQQHLNAAGLPEMAPWEPEHDLVTLTQTARAGSDAH